MSVKNELIEELINEFSEAAKRGKCRFEYYMNSEIKPETFKENLNVEKIPVLLDNWKETIP